MSVDRQIADAAKGGGRLPAMERAGDPFEDEPIGRTDIRQVGMERQGQNQRVGETAGALQHGPAAAGAPEHRNSVLFTGGGMDVVAAPATGAQHDEIAVAFPKPQDRLAAPFIQFVEQRIVQREVFHGGGEGQVEQAQRTHRLPLRQVDVGGLSVEGFGGFHDGLAQRGMGVNRGGHVLGRRTHFDRQDTFGDQLSRAGPADTHPQHAVRIPPPTPIS